MSSIAIRLRPLLQHPILTTTSAIYSHPRLRQRMLRMWLYPCNMTLLIVLLPIGWNATRLQTLLMTCGEMCLLRQTTHDLTIPIPSHTPTMAGVIFCLNLILRDAVPPIYVAGTAMAPVSLSRREQVSRGLKHGSTS